MRSTRRILALTAAMVTVALAATACTAGSNEPQDQAAGTAPLLRIASLQEPTSWDPAQVNEGHLAPLFQSVYDTLLKREADGTLSPMLATEWSVTDDLLGFDLTLRDDVVFSDGTELDAEVVKANIEHFQTANGPLQGNLNSIESVEVTGEHAVRLHLSAPDPSLQYWLAGAGGYVGSAEAIGTDEIVAEPVGSGPYLLDTATTVIGSKITLVRNEDYWGTPLPYDKVEFHVVTDETARLNALKSGQVDAAVLQRNASALDAETAGLRHEPFATNWEGVWYLDRNGEILPELADPRVREALTLAVDREALLDVVQLGKGTLSSQTYGPESLGFLEDQEDAYQYDPERARELLAEAGAEDLTFTLPISPVWDPAIYDALIQNWEAVGITVNRHEWGPGQAIPSMLRGEFPIVYMSLVRRLDWAQVVFLIGPDAPWNPFGTETEELNAHLDELQNATSDEQIETASQAINRYVIDNHWFNPIYRLEQHFYYNDSVDVVNQPEQAVPSIYNYTPAG
ncbi:ABC transporter substrate-binding protein [Okibacterium endophyticum]